MELNWIELKQYEYDNAMEMNWSYDMKLNRKWKWYECEFGNVMEINWTWTEMKWNEI